MELTEAQKLIIEKIGVTHEQRGMQPVVGRVIGLLMVAEPSEITFEEIIESLQISKSSASQALTLLQIKGLVEYTTHPGERKRYFHMRLRNWKENFLENLKADFVFEELLTQIIAMRKNQETPHSKNLEMIKRFLQFMRRKLPQILDEFEKEEKEKGCKN